MFPTFTRKKNKELSQLHNYTVKSKLFEVLNESNNFLRQEMHEYGYIV